jgi:hypothetical protein
MQTGVKASSKNIAMIKYAVELKTKQLCDLLQFEDETKIKAYLIAFVCSFSSEDIDVIIGYLARITMDINFTFDQHAFFSNKAADDQIISDYLEAKNIAWNIKADRSDFYDEALKLKSKKMNQSGLLKLSGNILASKLETYLYEQSIVDGTILDMLLHIKYLSHHIAVDLKGMNEMSTVEQIKLNRALNSLCE